MRPAHHGEKPGMPQEEDAIDGLIGQLYEAALSPELWHPTLLRMGSVIGADAFHLFAWDQGADSARLALISHPHFLDVIRKFDEYYGKIDVVRERALSVAPGHFFVTQDHFNERFIRGNEWFQDFMIPNEMCWSIGGTVPVEQQVHTVLAMLRANDRGRYEAEELERAHRIWAHFKRATSLFIQTESVRQRAAIGESGLDQMEIGILTTDDRGRVLYSNRLGDAIIRASRTLRVRQGAFGSTDPAVDASLQTAIKTAAERGRSSSLTVADSNGVQSDLLLTVSPIRESSSTWSVLLKPAALVLLRSRTRQRMLSGQQLVQLFRLSPAEARLARALALGKTPEEFATECELSMATVRTQLRKVFEKTGTARQAELMKLLVSVPPTRD